MRDGAKLEKSELFCTFAVAVHSAQQLMCDRTACIRAIAAASRWGKGRYATLKLLAASFATAPECCVWIAAPRLEGVDLQLELLLLVALTLAILVHVHQPEVE
jgi:hypothetical protein